MSCKNGSLIVRWGIGVGLLAAGCAPTGEFMPKPDLVPRETPKRFDDRDWALVLRENVRDDLVDYDHLARHREALDRFIALVSVVGPEATPGLFPDKSSRLAYWINLYNAQVLNIVVALHPVKSLYEITRPDVEFGYVFKADRKRRTLGETRRRLLEESGGDVRIHFALCAGAMGEPSLRQQPYRGASLDRDLAATTAAAMKNPRIVNIVHEEKQLRIWLRMMSNRQAFIKYHERHLRTRGATLLSVLLEFADDKQRAILNTAVGYKFRTIPLDRQLNQWQPTP